MRPRLRKLSLTVHVAASVGWLGAVGAFLGLSVVGLTSDDALVVRSVAIAMDATGRSVIVPLSMLSLFSGLVQAVGTPWGVFDHYWVVAKLAINVFASLVLLLYLQTLEHVASLATNLRAGGDLAGLQSLSPLLHAAAALVLLVVATVLSVFKPRGLTPVGRRRQRERQAARTLEPAAP